MRYSYFCRKRSAILCRLQSCVTVALQLRRYCGVVLRHVLSLTDWRPPLPLPPHINTPVFAAAPGYRGYGCYETDVVRTSGTYLVMDADVPGRTPPAFCRIAAPFDAVADGYDAYDLSVDLWKQAGSLNRELGMLGALYNWRDDANYDFVMIRRAAGQMT